MQDPYVREKEDQRDRVVKNTITQKVQTLRIIIGNLRGERKSFCTASVAEAARFGKGYSKNLNNASK
jgi:hypothetical protein